MIISDLPSILEWKVYRGDNASFTIFINDDNGQAEDTSGWGFNSSIKDWVDGNDLTQLNVVGNVGVITVALSSVQTAELPMISFFDIQATKPDGTVYTVLRGTIIVQKDVRR